MSDNYSLELIPAKRLFFLYRLVGGVVGTVVAIIVLWSTREWSLSDSTIALLIGAAIFGAVALMQLKSGVLDYLSISISDKKIIGPNGEPFAKDKVMFLLSEIDVTKTSTAMGRPLSFLDRLWRGDLQYIWSIHGQRIVIARSLFSRKQLNSLAEKIGCKI